MCDSLRSTVLETHDKNVGNVGFVLFLLFFFLSEPHELRFSIQKVVRVVVYVFTIMNLFVFNTIKTIVF